MIETGPPAPKANPTARELFRRHALDTPEAWAGERLRYGQLWRQALTLAEALPVKARCVAVCTRRNDDALLAFASCLVGSFRYLPCDLTDPLPRLERLLAVGRPDAVLVSSGLEGMLPWGAIPVLSVALVDEASPNLPLPEATSEIWARPWKRPGGYGMLTSGTGGVPRGVKVNRRALDSYVRALLERFPPEGQEVALHTASFGFSASIRQLLWPLMAGARLLMADEESRRSPAALLERALLSGVTVLDSVPSQLRAWTRTLARSPELVGRKLREVRLTGEELDWTSVHAWQKAAPGVAVHNLYSSTETAGTVASYRVPDTATETPATGAVPLGYPFPDVELRLLRSPGDEEELTGESSKVGQICVESGRMATGYLTEDRAVPLSVESLFRTGDYGEWDEEGRILGRGRRDRRVKLRGFRIDLQEVEREVTSDPEVREAVAWCDESRGSLAIRVIPERLAFDRSALRRRLLERLPEQLVPTLIEVVGELSRTATGKLVKPGSERWRHLRIFETWRRVLRRPDLAEHDDFFEVGGNSLLAVELVTLLEQELGVSLPPDAVFQASTPAVLSSRWESLQRGDQRPPGRVYRVQDGLPHLPPLVFVHLGWEHLKDLRRLARDMGPAYPVWALKAIDLLEGEPTVERLAQEYLRQLKVDLPQGPYRLAGYSFGGLVAYCMAGCLLDQGEEVAFLGLLDSYAPRLRRRVRPFRWGQNFKALAALPWSKKPQFVQEKLRRLVLPALLRHYRQAEPGGMEHMQALRTLYIHAGDRFRPTLYPGPAVLFESRGAASSPNPASGERRGWSSLVKGGLEVIPIPGGHHEVFQGLALQTVARRICSSYRTTSPPLIEPARMAELQARLHSEVPLLVESPVKWCEEQYRAFLEAVDCVDGASARDSLVPYFLLTRVYPSSGSAWRSQQSTLKLIRRIEAHWFEELAWGQPLLGRAALVHLTKEVDPTGRERLYYRLCVRFSPQGSSPVAEVHYDLVEMALEASAQDRERLLPGNDSDPTPEEARLTTRRFTEQTRRAWGEAVPGLKPGWNQASPRDNGLQRFAETAVDLHRWLLPEHRLVRLNLHLLGPRPLGRSHQVEARRSSGSERSNGAEFPFVLRGILEDGAPITSGAGLAVPLRSSSAASGGPQAGSAGDRVGEARNAIDARSTSIPLGAQPLGSRPEPRAAP